MHELQIETVLIRARKAIRVRHRTCTPTMLGIYELIKDEYCGLATGCAGLNANDPHQCRKLISNAKNAAKCADMRQIIMDDCFGGGDAGHKKAADDKRLNSLDCIEKIMESPACRSEFYNSFN